MDLNSIKTEQRNSRTAQIDTMSTQSMVKLINEEDKKVAEAVGAEAEHIAQAVDVIAAQLKQGGRLVYSGCGTSGRLGVLDAVECPPTYSTDPGEVIGLIAGGNEAIFRAKEGAEDDEALGAEDLKKIDFSPKAGIKKLTLTNGKIYAGDAVKDLKDSDSFVFLFQTPVM